LLPKFCGWRHNNVDTIDDCLLSIFQWSMVSVDQRRDIQARIFKLNDVPRVVWKCRTNVLLVMCVFFANSIHGNQKFVKSKIDLNRAYIKEANRLSTPSKKKI